MDDNINSIRQFLNEFSETNVEENVKCRSSIISSYYMNPEDVKAEVLDWSLHFLEQRKCPYSLALMLAKLVAHQLSDSVYQAEEGIDDDKRFRYESSQLYTEMIKCLSEACTNLQDPVDINAVKVELPSRIVSFSAIKNTRRKMEDRHVILHDLNAVCGLKDIPQHSYYAIFDGHAGVEAASYCAAHLHWNITSHPEFLTNTEKAIFEAVVLTDRNLLERSYREGIKGGCTALCCLIRDRIMYIAWVGDSQAVLVKQGTPVPLGLPHKPDREDERCRVEELGGFVVYLGTWRVNGTLAVSRALGDAEHKPYINNEPEILKIPLDGTEDYVVLACDGLWDRLQPSDIGQVVYNHIIEGAESVDKVASKLVQLSKSQGSTDNITAIVVFLKDPLNISKSEPIFPQLQNRNEEKDLQVNGTSLSDDFLNSEEIIKQTVNTDELASNDFASEELKNELNSLNFPQSTVMLSHLQEKTLTSETLVQQYEQSYENPSLQNYCRGDISFSYAQSTPTSLSNSVNSSTSQISDSFDLNQHIIVETEQHSVNENIIENVSNSVTSYLNSTNKHTKDPANLNQLVTINRQENSAESNADNLMEFTVCASDTELGEKEVLMPNNDFVVLEEKFESSNEKIKQFTTDLEVDSSGSVSNMNENKIDEGIEEIFKNSGDTLNAKIFELHKEETLSNIASSNNYGNTVSHLGDLCKKMNSISISNNLQTEIKASNNDVLHSESMEKFHKQEAIFELKIENSFGIAEEKIINNNNFHPETEDSSIVLDKKEFSHNCLDISDFDKKETVSKFPSTHDPIIANKLSAHISVDNAAATNSIQTENETQTINALLHSMDETYSDILETPMEFTSKKCANNVDTELNLCDKTTDMALNNDFREETKASRPACSIDSFQEKQLEETEISSNNKENLLLYSTDVLDFDKNETIYDLPSQNDSLVSNELNFYTKEDNITINNSFQPEIRISNNDIGKSDSIFHSTEEIISKELIKVPKLSENIDNITNSELNMLNKNDGTTFDDNFQPENEIYSYSNLNKEDSSLHSVDAPDCNKCELIPELTSPQDCINITVEQSSNISKMQNANVASVSFQNNEKSPVVDLENTNEIYLSSGIIDTDVLHNEHKITDISSNLQIIEQDVTKNKISTDSYENVNSISSMIQDIKYAAFHSKSEAVDDLIRQPKCDQVEKIPIFESPINQVSNEISNLQISDASIKDNTGHLLPHSKELLTKSDSKTVSMKKSTVKGLMTSSSNIGNRRQITSKPVKGSSLKSVQAQQLKVKQIATNKDIKQKTVHETEVKSPEAARPKHSQPNVFERLSSPKVTSTKPKENRSKENLHLSKGASGTITKSVFEAKTRNNLSQLNKASNGAAKTINSQSQVPENIKLKTHTNSVINNTKFNTKPHKPPLSNQIITSKASRGNVSQKTDDKLFRQPEIPNVVKKSSNTTHAVATKRINSSASASKQDATRQKLPHDTKMAERVQVKTSNRQATPFRPTASTKLDTKQINIASSLQSCNSKTISGRNTRIVVERSSISNAKMKEGKTTVAKSAVGQKKESNTTAKVEKRCQIQKPSSSNHKKSSMPNMDGQGDCIASNKDSRLPDINGENIELSKSIDSKEVPNSTLDG